MRNKFILVLALAVMFTGYVSAKGIERDVDGTPLPSGVRYRAFVHYPHPGKPALKPPACTTTASDPSDYLAAGWHLTGPRVYRLNETTAPRGVMVANVYSAVNAAWNAWHGVDSAIVTTQGSPTGASRPKFDGVNLLAWGDVPSNAIAVTYTWYYTDTGNAVESDTIFNRRLGWSYAPYSTDCGGVVNTYDVGDIATHEFGHWVGLDDLYSNVDKDITMYGYGFLGELKKDTLGSGDAIGAAAITP